METAIVGGGCFWCLEAVFEQVKGVERGALAILVVCFLIQAMNKFVKESRGMLRLFK